MLYALTLDTAGGTCVGNTRRGVVFGVTGDAGSGLFDQRQRETLGAAGTLRNFEFAINTLGEATTNACLLVILAR